MGDTVYIDDDIELMAQCYDYFRIVNLPEPLDLTKIYLVCVARLQTYEFILELTRLDKKDLHDVINNMDRYPTARDLYVEIVDIRNQKRKGGN